MTDKERLDRIQADLQKATTVIYLEKKSDPDLFFALLGIPRPRSGIHDDAYVVGLESDGGGARGVKANIRVAQKNGLSDILGVIDGDGRDLATLSAQFDPPYAGPLFSWKAYCIENLAAKAAWPPTWGNRPDFRDYAPYVAFNRVQRQLQENLQATEFTNYASPKAEQPLANANELRVLLAEKKAAIAAVDTKAKYDKEIASYRAAVGAGDDEAHLLLNGKWLVEHHACKETRKSKAKCRDDWATAVRKAGGLAEVRDWWRRVTGNAP